MAVNLQKRAASSSPDKARGTAAGGRGRRREGDLYESIHAIMDLRKLWYRAAGERLATLGITPGEFRTLKFVAHAGPCSMAKLAEDQMMTPGGVTALVDRLEARGLLQRVRSGTDRRVILLRITTAGQRLTKGASILYESFFRDCLSCLTDAELRKFLGLQRKILDSAAGGRPGGAPVRGGGRGRGGQQRR